jgi:hypothetical protein
MLFNAATVLAIASTVVAVPQALHRRFLAPVPQVTYPHDGNVAVWVIGYQHNVTWLVHIVNYDVINLNLSRDFLGTLPMPQTPLLPSILPRAVSLILLALWPQTLILPMAVLRSLCPVLRLRPTIQLSVSVLQNLQCLAKMLINVIPHQ